MSVNFRLITRGRMSDMLAPLIAIPDSKDGARLTRKPRSTEPTNVVRSFGPGAKTAEPQAGEYKQETGRSPLGPGITWSFANIPVFAPDGTQARTGSHLAAGPVSIPVQPKLAIAPTGDRLEREADSTAERVLRMAEPPAEVAVSKATHTVQRKCECGGRCTDCQNRSLEDQAPPVRMKTAGASGAGKAEAPSIVHNVLRSPGQPLDRASRAFFEPRFQQDFSRVRVHADSAAAASARAVAAQAYTVGQDIVFAANKLAPETHEGRRLLAHELAHVTQQEGSAHLVQRITETEAKCPGYIDDEEVRTSKTEKGRLADDVFPFPTGSENLLVADFGVDWRSVKESTSKNPVLKNRLRDFEADPVPRLQILGFSDCVAGERYNVHLRKGRAANVFRLLGPKSETRATFEAAPKGEYLVANDTPDSRAMNRSVLIKSDRGITSKPGPQKVCGPDATPWFINAVKDATANRDVLRIKQDFETGNAIMAYLGLPDLRLLAEFFVDEKVTTAWEKAGRPAEQGEAKGERLSAASGFFALAQAEQKIGKMNTMELLQLSRAKDLLKDAALTWMALVQDKAVFDFKNNTLKDPHSKSCPADCKSTLTLCDMCFGTDVPGNIFYAHVGRFAGWSDLALRLGSQYAQLISKTKGWDPPEDSAMITIGLKLPDPLTVKALCDALRSDASAFTKPCASCGEPMQI